MRKVSYSVKVPVSILKQGKRYVAYTPALDLSTSGKSEREVKKRFSEVVAIFMQEIIEAGTQEEVFKELGWQKVRKQWEPPRVVSKESQVRIPLSV